MQCGRTGTLYVSWQSIGSTPNSNEYITLVETSLQPLSILKNGMLCLLSDICLMRDSDRIQMKRLRSKLTTSYLKTVEVAISKVFYYRKKSSMTILGVAAATYLLITSSESYVLTTSSDLLRRSKRRNLRLRCELLDSQPSLRRSFLNQSVLAGFSLVVGIQPTFAAGTSMVENSMPSSKNKKLGGLASKIQSVGHVMVSRKVVSFQYRCYVSPN